MKAKYTPAIRAFEWVSIMTNVLLSVFLMGAVYKTSVVSPAQLIALSVSAWVIADFVSGFVHWLADTWGSEDMPILGPVFIRSFREHHIDPMSITRHDWVETNGANCFISIPILLGLSLLQIFKPEILNSHLVLGYVIFNFWIVLTNQIHKWAHEKNPASWVAGLQRTRIILSPDVHARHHRDKHDEYFSITSGATNTLLTSLGFFRRLEWVISRLTGAQPRKDGF